MEEKTTDADSRVVRYHPKLRSITGSVKSAILLAQIDYWWSRKSGRTLYKTDNELAEELNFTPKELRNAKNKLKELNLVTVQRKGIPPRSHYTLEVSIEELLNIETAQKDKKCHPYGHKVLPEKAEQSSPKGQYNSCITQDNTQQNTSVITSSTVELKKIPDSTLLRQFLTRWQVVVGEDDWDLPLDWHQKNPALDKKIISHVRGYGGVEELVFELRKRCANVSEDQVWRFYEEKTRVVNLPFLLNADP